MTILLFVKSQPITIPTRGKGTKSLGRGSPSFDEGDRRASYTLKREEAKAREKLKREGIKFETIDLSKGLPHRPQAGFSVITVTPTLLDAHSPGKWYVGSKAIPEYIEETRASARRSPTHWTTRSRWV